MIIHISSGISILQPDIKEATSLLSFDHLLQLVKATPTQDSSTEKQIMALMHRLSWAVFLADQCFQ